jgi:hypothetical protein
MDANMIGGFGAAYYGGAVLGMISNWYLPDKIGRLYVKCRFLGVSTTY